MPATNFDAPVYASTNPAVADLFRSEFAQRQAQQAAYEALAAQDTRRQEIAAQERLAQAQLKAGLDQQNYNNLFRVAEFNDRKSGGDEQRALLTRQLDIDQKYKEGLVAKPGNRTAADQEAFNTDSDTISNQLQSAYDTKYAIASAALKKVYDDTAASSGLFGYDVRGTIAKAKADYETALANLPDKIFSDVQDMATRYYPPASYRADPISKKFFSVRGRTGNAASATVSPVAGEAPVPFNMSGSAGAPESVDQGTGEGTTPYTMISPSGSVQSFSTRDAMNAAAPAAMTAPAPVAQLVRIKVPGGTLELPSNLADEAERQLRGGTAASLVLDQLMKSGQARLLPVTALTPTQTLPPIPLGY